MHEDLFPEPSHKHPMALSYVSCITIPLCLVHVEEPV